MQTSPQLGLAYIQPQQAQKHVTANETFRRLDALVQLSAKSATAGAEPGGPAEGERYILPAAASGAAWSLMDEGDIAAFQDGAWAAYAPQEGWRCYVEDRGETLVSIGGVWKAQTRLGVNTASDATNRLAVKADAVLFSHDDVTPGSGDARVKVNKAAAADTASLLLQTAFSGRAEIGLTGDDDLRVKVTADGATWRDAMVIDKDTGWIGIGTPAPEGTLHFVRGPTGGGFYVARQDDSTSGGGITVRKSRGSEAAPTAVLSGDVISANFGQGYDGASWIGCANLRWVAEAAPAGGIIPTYIEFMTMNAGGLAERLRITSAGYVGIGVTAPACKLDIDGPAKVKSYAKAALPSAAAGAGQIVYVSDEAGGATIAFSDGASWRRVADRAVVS